MIYIFLISFFIYLIVDYIYISIFFDSKFFMKESGSKLKYILNIKQGSNNKCNLKKILNNLFKKDKLKLLIIFILFLLILNLINFLLFQNIFFSKFIILNIGYKNIELVSTFENYWQYFKNLYVISFNTFLAIIFSKVVKKYNMKLDRSKLKKENQNDLNNRVYIGCNEKEKVYLNKEELYKNLLITGSIGTGKTYSGINKFCKYMI